MHLFFIKIQMHFDLNIYIPLPRVEPMKLIIKKLLVLIFEFYQESFVRARRQIADVYGIWDKWSSKKKKQHFKKNLFFNFLYVLKNYKKNLFFYLINERFKRFSANHRHQTDKKTRNKFDPLIKLCTQSFLYRIKSEKPIFDFNPPK